MDLDVEQDESFSRREWAVERVGWALIAAFVLAGLLGVLGSGPLTWSTTDAGAPVVVHYDSAIHHLADESITLELGPDAVEGDTASVRLTGPWVAGIEIQGIWPEPSAQQLVPDGVLLEFDVATPGDLAVTLTYRAQEYGPLDAEVTAGDDVVAFSQLVLP